MTTEEKLPKLQEGERLIKREGNWFFSQYGSKFYVTYIDGYYHIDLESFTDSAHILDWILQLSGKGWVKDQDIGSFVRLVEDFIFEGLQGKVCPWGTSKTIEPIIYLSKFYRKSDDFNG